MLINQETDKRISDYLLGNLSEQERQAITAEIDEDFLNGLLDADDITDRYESYAKADTEKALRKALDIAYPPHRSYGWRIAAVMLCLIATGTFFWYKDYSRVVPPVIGQEVESLMVKALESQRVGTGASTAPSDEETAYKETLTQDYLSTFQFDAGKAEEMLQAENITTYYNKEYWLTLNDGTIVHLDANSRIIYPEHFSRFGTREVVLDGNAYFMVAHDRSRKFVVHTKSGSITDYGTEFYISGRHGLEVALISGSAGVMPHEGQEQMLIPGEKISIAENGDMNKEKFDVEEYKAWNTGRFAFAGKDLQTVMSIIGRWYGVNTYYDKEQYRHILITGNYDRCPEVGPLLESLEYVTGLRFVMNGNSVEVK